MNTLEDFLKPEFLWIYAGLIFGLIEYFISGYVCYFLAIGSVITGVSAAIFDLGMSEKYIVFCTSSFLGIVFFRLKVKEWGDILNNMKFIPRQPDLPPIGSSGIAVTDIKPGRVGKIKLPSEFYDATSSKEIKQGELVKIIKSHVLLLEVEFLDKL